MLILFLALVGIAMFCVVKILAPEMRKAPIRRVADHAQEIHGAASDDARVRKLETLLVEKNKNINILQTELKVFHIQVQNFDKIRSLLEEEIVRLREQNRIFRSELGLPSAAPKENSIV